MRNIKNIKFGISVMMFLTLAGIILFGETVTAPAQIVQKKSEQKTTPQKTKTIRLTAVRSRGRKDKILSREKRLGRFKTTPRGEYGCSLELKNNTNYQIDIYVNGKSWGSASAAGLYTGTVGVGSNSFYVRTGRIINNNFLYWGPSASLCSLTNEEAIKLFINPKR